MLDNIADDWRAGMSYSDLHDKYGPWAQCECDTCDTARERQREEDDALDHTA
jgi:hypothetical protein